MTSTAKFGATKLATGKLYGATWSEGEGMSHLPLGNKKEARASFDTAWLFAIVMGPLLLFALLFFLESFRFHYKYPTLIWLVVLVGLFPALFFGYLSCTSRSSDWSKFLTQTFFLAWLFALVVGSMNYNSNSAFYYQITNLNSYVMVDPTLPGATTNDAGQLLFQKGAAVDVSKAMSVMVGSVFCVAPISLPNAGPNISYDYWAVGVDCCSSTQPQADNKCPGTPYTRATSAGALRLIDSTNRAYFRMAVQEAEATYKINAASPIFLTFTEDPYAAVNVFRENGSRMYVFGVFSFFVLEVFLLMSAFFCFGSAVLRSHDSEYGFYKLAQEDYPELAQGDYFEGIARKTLKSLKDEIRAIEDPDDPLTL